MGRPRREAPDQVRVVGRAGLIAEAAGAVRAESRVACLVGAPGIGKTSVWSAAVEQSGLPVVARLTCFEAEAGLGWATLADMLTAAGEDCLAGLPVAHRRVAEVILLRRPAEELAVPLDPRVAGSVLLSVLASLPESLIAIDDVQWCDAGSLGALRYALRRGTGLHVRWLTARRPTGGGELPGEQMIPVAKMDAVDLRAVVAEHLGRTLSPPILAELVRVSGGNPFYALEIVRSLPPDAAAADVLGSPNLTELVATRLGQVPKATSRALLDVAVRATVSREYEHLADLDPAFETGVLGWTPNRAISFTHPLLAAGILAVAPPGALAAAHTRAADHEADIVARARHLAAATMSPDEQIAAQLDDAVKVAVARGDVRSAAQLAEQAVTLGTQATMRWERLLTATRTSGKVADPRAQQWGQELVDLSRPGPQRAIALSELHRVTNDLPTSLAVTQRSLQEPGLDSELRGALLSDLGYSLIIQGRFRESADALGREIEALSVEGPGWADAVGAWALACRFSGQPVDMPRLERAVEIMRRAFVREDPFVTLGLIATWDDRHDDARAIFTEAITLSDATSRHSESRGHLAELMIRTGELSDGVRLQREVAADKDGQELGGANASLALALAWLGDEDGCRTAAAQARKFSLAAGDGLFWVASDVFLGFLELILGNYETAWTRLSEIAEVMHQQGLVECSRFPGVALAIEAAAALGRLDDANRLLDRLQQQAELLDSRWARAAVSRGHGHITAASDPSAALGLLGDAATAFQKLRLPLEQARTLLTRGELARRNRQRALARTSLTEALDIFDRHDAKILAARTRDELAKLGGRAASGSELTTSELTTAHLAASGLTNAQIARQLSVSVKTVETHLGHVFHKLGVHSRVQLANVIARRPAPRRDSPEDPSGRR